LYDNITLMETDDGVVLEAPVIQINAFSKNKIIIFGVIVAIVIFVGGFLIGKFYQADVSVESLGTEGGNLTNSFQEQEKYSDSDQSSWAMPQRMIEEIIPYSEGQRVGDFVYRGYERLDVYRGYERLDGTSNYVLTFIGTTTITGRVDGFVNPHTAIFNYYASNNYTFYPDQQSLQKLPTLQIPNDSFATVYNPVNGLWFQELYLYPDIRNHLKYVLDSQECHNTTTNCSFPYFQYKGEYPSFEYKSTDMEIGIVEYKLYVCMSNCTAFEKGLTLTEDQLNTGWTRYLNFGEIDLTHLKNQISLKNQIKLKYFSNNRPITDRQSSIIEVVFSNSEEAYNSNKVPFYSLVAETEDYLILSINCFRETECGDNGLYKVNKQTRQFGEMNQSERYSTMWTAPTVSPDNEKIVVVSVDGLEIGYIDIASDSYSQLSLLNAEDKQVYVEFGMGNYVLYEWINDRSFDVQIYSSEQLGVPLQKLQKQRITIPD